MQTSCMQRSYVTNWVVGLNIFHGFGALELMALQQEYVEMFQI